MAFFANRLSVKVLFVNTKSLHRYFVPVIISTRKMSNTVPDNKYFAMIRKIVPSLDSSLHKGQNGRIGVVGGCKEYTGAPYFAGISALKVGADLSHVFCTEGAGTVIKSYSPELIVHPVLDSANACEEIEQWLPRLHTLVIGPGLGRESDVLTTTRDVIGKAKERNLPLVIDADGLFLVTETPDVIKDYKRAILTPNKIEFSRLFEKVLGKSISTPYPSEVQTLAKELGGVTIVSKGPVDIISNGTSVLYCKEQGSNRRCGGQGDLLSGALGVFTHWCLSGSESEIGEAPTILAGYAACFLTRECSRQAFELHKRSMTTSDMIQFIGQVFNLYFEVD